MPRPNLIMLALILTACATPTPLPTLMPVPTVLPTPTFAPTTTAAPTLTPTLAPTFAPTATATIAVPLIITRDANAFSREVTVPILMYHYIEPVPSNNKDQLRADLTVTPEKFEAQLKFLKERGYTSIDLYQFYGALARGDKLPAKPVVITFDDGYGDLHEYAFPLMQKYGFTGTIFMITDFTDAQKPEYIVWAKALEMARAGWRLESHTKNHPSLEGQSVEFQRDQLKGSMDALKKNLGYTPRFLAYPYGKFDQNSIKILQEVGYWGAVTTNIGRHHSFGSLYTSPRVRVNGYNELPAFAQALGEKAP